MTVQVRMRVSYLEHAVDYWIEMKDLLNETKAYAIVNIANEWYGTYNDLETWRDAYINAVKKLRDAGIENTLIVDSAGWGQCADSVLKYGNEILKADKGRKHDVCGTYVWYGRQE